MDIQKLFIGLEFNAQISVGHYPNKRQLILRLDELAEFVVPKEVEEQWKQIPDLNRMEPVPQFKLLLKLMLERAAGE